jgi:hypothetical protein
MVKREVVMAPPGGPSHGKGDARRKLQIPDYKFKIDLRVGRLGA